MWEMATTIDKELYEEEYRLSGEKNRVDIIDSKGKKYFEIFFFGSNDIRIRKGKEYWKVEKIFKITVGKNKKPEIKTFPEIKIFFSVT